MPLAVANRYAAALAEVVSEPAAEISPDEAMTQLEALATTLETSAELRGVLITPAVSLGAKHKLAKALAEKLGLAKPIRNLALVLIDNGRIGMLGELRDAFGAWLDRRNGVERIRVMSAAALDDAQRATLIERFEALTAKRVEATFAVDRNLLGGTVVRLGSKLYDGSLATQLRSLDRAMAGAA